MLTTSNWKVYLIYFVSWSDEITLVALGPLTNLALAMRLDDQFATNLKELYIMGGNVEGEQRVYRVTCSTIRDNLYRFK